MEYPEASARSVLLFFQRVRTCVVEKRQLISRLFSVMAHPRSTNRVNECTEPCSGSALEKVYQVFDRRMAMSVTTPTTR